ncbi:T9SS type B sorting domain-containing protein [Flavobacterium stagni]|uniref:T9SS type B sorting domain-containing protein n=1 Tax=Flavobacterium stagni TaxID=2506421 RepID=A0A4Q1K9T2_9FLAO|nr:T9SS type B sorting domain-containing protein [Flavobacterium stagni]RXR23346.1 T9SS type B sorting domain-containing protein [Flavobacterium stagni]
MSKKILFALLLIFPLSIWGQSDCDQSVITCGNTSFSNLPVNGSGNVQELNPQNTCGSGEYNSIWIKVTIKTAGTLAFTITPANSSLVVDYDFFVFDGSNGCSALGNAIRCSTTNPNLAGLNYNTTGLNDTETEYFEGPGSDGNGYVQSIMTYPDEVYYIVVNRAIGNGNFSLDWEGTATFNDPPNITNTTNPNYLDLNLCQPDSSQGVDITQNSNLAIGSQTNITTQYFLTDGDALSNTNPILDPTHFIYTSNPQQLYIRLENSLSECSTFAPFILTVTNLNLPDLPDLELCDTNGTGLQQFNFTNYASLMSSNGANSVTFLDDINSSIPLPVLYTNANPYQEETIWVKVTNTATNCSVFKSFKIKIHPLPPVQSISLSQCDFELNPDGLTLYNLNHATTTLSNGNVDYSVSYYLNDSDANLGVNPLNFSYQSIQNPQLITAKITNTTTGCSSLSHVNLITSVNPTQSVSLMNCVDPTTGSSSFLFSDAGYETPGSVVTYFTSLQDALLESNPIINQPYTSTISNQLIYVRVENVLETCIGLHLIQLSNYEIPQATLLSSGILCKNLPSQPVYLTCQVQTAGNYTFQWNPGTSTTSTLAVFAPGNYTVTLTDTTTGCQNSATIEVFQSEIPQLTEIQIVDLIDANSITVIVDGIGDYWYSLDDSPLQNSPHFEPVIAGEHTIKVWDKNGCGMIFTPVSLLGIPNYFTPNLDGVHDHWQIKGIQSSASKVKEFLIFDRYGKVIFAVDPLKSGWDGTINNRPAPADDYWYVLQMNDGRVFKGHFSLKR